MKVSRLIVALLVPAIGLLAGCQSSNVSNYAAFIQKIPAITATDIRQATVTPVYNHSESASGISTDPVTGLITIVNGHAALGIPEFGVSWDFSISGLKLQASADQLALAKAIATQGAAAPPAH